MLRQFCWMLMVMVVMHRCADFAELLSAELLPAETPVEQAIDHYIQLQLDTKQKQPANQKTKICSVSLYKIIFINFQES